MSTFEVAVVAAITLCFVGFAVVLAWGAAQTRNMPPPPKA